MRWRKPAEERAFCERVGRLEGPEIEIYVVC